MTAVFTGRKVELLDCGSQGSCCDMEQHWQLVLGCSADVQLNSVLCAMQLYREVRIMKMLDHPNIGWCLHPLTSVISISCS